MNGRQLRKLRRLSYVPRWCVTPTIQRQTVADHSFGVAVAAMWLMIKWNTPPEVYGLVLTLAITHDEDEAISGDLPGPYKHKNDPQLRTRPDRFTPADIVKCADMLDRLAFLQAEAQLGNRALREVETRNRAAFCERWGRILMEEWLEETAISTHPLHEECP